MRWKQLVLVGLQMKTVTNTWIFEVNETQKVGQHFLTSQSVIARILESAAVQPGDHILEIGPGQGALTKHLVEIGVHLTVIKIDPDMQALIAGKISQCTSDCCRCQSGKICRLVGY